MSSHGLLTKPVFWFGVSIVSLLASAFQFVGFDSAYYINGYRYFLTYPQSSMFEMQYYLSFVIGDLLGLDTILKARLVGFLLVAFFWWLAYAALKDLVSRRYIGVALFLATVGMYGAPMEMSYNHLSVLFLMVAIILMVKGIQSRWLLLLAGCILSISTFLRFPNVILVGMGLLPFCYRFIDRKYPWVNTLYMSLLFYVGYVCGFLLMYLMMNRVGHWSVFVDAVTYSVTSSVTSPDGNDHGAGRLLFKTLFTYVVPWLLGCIVFVVYCLGMKKMMKCDACGGSRGRMWFMAGLTLYALAISKSASFLFIPFCTAMLLVNLFDKSVSPVKRYYTLMALVMIYVAPLGSSSIMNFYLPFLFWLALPLSFDFLECDSLRFREISLLPLVRAASLSMLIAVVLKYALFWTFSIYTGDNRWNSFYAIKSDNYKGTYVNKGKAGILNEVIEQFGDSIAPGTPLVVNDCYTRSVLSTAPFGLSTTWIPYSQIRFMVTNAYEEQKRYPWVMHTTYELDSIKAIFGAEVEYELVKEYKDLKLYRPVEQ